MYIYFRTYHKVELHAGPNVNLILGPNGTGKSTIVCAICIGLAGKPKILGRALSLKEYIRHECTYASIEIELYNPNGENYVVKRHIKASNTSAVSTWQLNGKKTSQNQVWYTTISVLYYRVFFITIAYRAIQLMYFIYKGRTAPDQAQHSVGQSVSISTTGSSAGIFQNGLVFFASVDPVGDGKGHLDWEARSTRPTK